MTTQEAINVLEKYKIVPKSQVVKEAYTTAISALEKQIPKKPRKEIWVDDEKHKGDVRLATKDDILTESNHGIINRCPICDEWASKRNKYCPCCGQALDWSDTE